MLSFIAQTVKKIISIRCGADGPPVVHRSARSRVELVVDFQHSFFEDMGIDLRGRDIGMTQHLLDGSQIGPPLQ